MGEKFTAAIEKWYFLVKMVAVWDRMVYNIEKMDKKYFWIQ